MWNKGGAGTGLGACVQNQPCDIRNPLDCGESGVCDTGGAYVYHGLVQRRLEPGKESSWGFL